MGDYNKAANSEQADEPLELDNFAGILKLELLGCSDERMH